MKIKDKGHFVVIGIFISAILALTIFLFLNIGKLDTNTRIIEVGQENSGNYCNIEYFDLEKITPETVEKNKQKCTEAVIKLFGKDKAEDVKIRYKHH